MTGDAILETDPNAGGPRWVLEGAVLNQVSQDIEFEHDRLELIIRATPPEGIGWGSRGWSVSPWGGEVGTEFWHQFDRAGDFEVDVAYGGSWDAIPTGAEDMIVDLEPPERLRPPFAVSRWIVEDVETVRASPVEVLATVELRRVGPREDVYPDDVVEGDPHEDTHTAWSYDGWGETPWGGFGTYSWSIDLARGSLELRDRFVGRPERSSGAAGEQIELPLALDHDQAAAVADSLGRMDGLVEHAVPGGDDLVVDETVDGNQTIELTVPVDVPDVDDLESGMYYVRDWSIQSLGGHQSERPWLATLALTRAK